MGLGRHGARSDSNFVVMKKALITGITGQDGSYLADLLLEKDYEVYGLERRLSTKNRENVRHIEDKIHWITGDMTDKASLLRALQISTPDEVYNLAAQSFVGHSWQLAEQTTMVNGMGVLFLLQAILEHDKNIRFYQASTSEMFGKVVEDPQSEQTPFRPRSPYAVSKLYAHEITRNLRESYGLYASCGILFNHESPRRGLEFVTRKICDGVARIAAGLEDHIALGNVQAKRDWGYAPEYVEGMWRMLQQDEPDDYVLATGNTYSIKDFLDCAFAYIGILDWEPYVKKDPRYYRPAEVDVLRGDASKAKEKLGWEAKVELKELVDIMMLEEAVRYGIFEEKVS